MNEITPDLIEWMVADDLVASKWRSFGSYLGLSAYIPGIEARRNRGRGRSDRQRLGDLLAIWKLAKPQTYNVHDLLKLLDKQGLKDMYEWVRLMTGQTLSKADIESLVMRQVTSTSRPQSVRSELPVGSARLRPASQYYSLPTSPRYTPQPSRPLSQISFLNDSTVSSYTRSSVSPSRRDGAESRQKQEYCRFLPQRSPGVFDTLYQPQFLRRATSRTPTISYSCDRSSYDESGRRSSQVISPEPKYRHRHSSYVTEQHREEPLLKILEDSVTSPTSSRVASPSRLSVAPVRGASPSRLTGGQEGVKRNQVSRPLANRFKHFNTFEANLQHCKQMAHEKDQGRLTSEKYFDNLISLIEEASSSLEI